MLFTRSTHQLTAWLAMFAMLWSAIAPTLAQAAVASSGSPAWVEVCSTSGVVWVRVDNAADASTTESAPMAKAASGCAWCLLQGSADVPPTHATTALVTQAPGALPGGMFASIVPAAVWSAAQSRAPPLV
jgi:hypothetical protein